MYTTTSTLGMPHKKWLALRKTGLGGSDAGAKPVAEKSQAYKKKQKDEGGLLMLCILAEYFGSSTIYYNNESLRRR